jgi:hypothetical protein
MLIVLHNWLNATGIIPLGSFTLRTSQNTLKAIGKLYVIGLYTHTYIYIHTCGSHRQFSRRSIQNRVNYIHSRFFFFAESIKSPWMKPPAGGNPQCIFDSEATATTGWFQQLIMEFADLYSTCWPLKNFIQPPNQAPKASPVGNGLPWKLLGFFLSDIAEMSHFKERDVFQAWLIQLLANGDPAAKDFCCCSDEGHLLPLRTWKMDRCKRGCSKWKCGCEPTTMRCNPSKTLTIFYI